MSPLDVEERQSSTCRDREGVIPIIAYLIDSIACQPPMSSVEVCEVAPTPLSRRVISVNARPLVSDPYCAHMILDDCRDVVAAQRGWVIRLILIGGEAILGEVIGE